MACPPRAPEGALLPLSAVSLPQPALLDISQGSAEVALFFGGFPPPGTPPAARAPDAGLCCAPSGWMGGKRGEERGEGVRERGRESREEGSKG